MEGRHCVAGPWFTVHRLAAGWHTLDVIWISNGTTTCKARVEARVAFEEPAHAS